jgi:hypothetical protein
MNLAINIMGWAGSVLIVGAYFLNIKRKISSESYYYLFANLFGGILFIVNTFYLKAYPSMMVNIIWVIIAVSALLKKKRIYGRRN